MSNRGVVVIASSVGDVDALQELVGQFPADYWRANLHCPAPGRLRNQYASGHSESP
ncbi:hypothetical protein [Fibrella arboris]|uniref:hypothetical protein n=1 Tax=Fibrella arboris TaxID=3242486 RepID=UPI0035224353